MARASTKTLLSLDRFAQIIGIHPLHFNQVEVHDLAVSAVCETPLIQYSWQDANRVGREEIAYAINDAERMISEQTRFTVLPDWVIERVRFNRPGIPEIINLNNLDIRGYKTSLKTSLRELVYGGLRTNSVISAGAAIVYSDSDSDGYFETATIVVPTTVTNSEEICVYYPGYGGQDSYEIRPITVAIAGGIATITCRREQLVLLNLMEGLVANGVDGLNNANFLTTVDVYRKYNNPAAQAILEWENSCSCGSSTCAACTTSYQNACIQITNSEVGLIRLTPAEWDSVNLQFTEGTLSACKQPDKAVVYYKAGWGYLSSHIRMDPMWERAVTYLALSQLDRPLCGCGHLSALTEHWREDLSNDVTSQAGRYRTRIPERVFLNPFGTTRGAIYAWRIVQKYLGDSVNA